MVSTLSVFIEDISLLFIVIVYYLDSAKSPCIPVTQLFSTREKHLEFISQQKLLLILKS